MNCQICFEKFEKYDGAKLISLVFQFEKDKPHLPYTEICKDCNDKFYNLFMDIFISEQSFQRFKKLLEQNK